MPSADPTQTDFVAWARRVNGRWIVHEKLNERAEAYMDHLAKLDTERLARSCQAAYEITHQGEATQDPKPLFYGGLFSQATAEEAKIFLAGHWFTSALVPALAEDPLQKTAQQRVGQATWREIERLREMLGALSAKASPG